MGTKSAAGMEPVQLLTAHSNLFELGNIYFSKKIIWLKYDVGVIGASLRLMCCGVCSGSAGDLF